MLGLEALAEKFRLGISGLVLAVAASFGEEVSAQQPSYYQPFPRGVAQGVAPPMNVIRPGMSLPAYNNPMQPRARMPPQIVPPPMSIIPQSIVRIPLPMDYQIRVDGAYLGRPYPSNVPHINIDHYPNGIRQPGTHIPLRLPPMGSLGVMSPVMGIPVPYNIVQPLVQQLTTPPYYLQAPRNF